MYTKQTSSKNTHTYTHNTDRLVSRIYSICTQKGKKHNPRVDRRVIIYVLYTVVYRGCAACRREYEIKRILNSN